ncbi:hypothetical protein M514_10852, partial [Trichuris suis]
MCRRHLSRARARDQRIWGPCCVLTAAAQFMVVRATGQLNCRLAAGNGPSRLVERHCSKPEYTGRFCMSNHVTAPSRARAHPLFESSFTEGEQFAKRIFYFYRTNRLRANAPRAIESLFRRPKRPTVMHKRGCQLLIILPLSLLGMVGAKLINSPPKLELESPREVWFHIPTTGQPQKFTLKCHASGDPERYQWFKNGRPFNVDGHRIVWQRPGQSGSITFLQPQVDDKGYYQCSVSNIFGVAMSHIFDVKIGALNHFERSPVRDVMVVEGQPLTLRCNKPYGMPPPTIFWLYRDMKKSYAMDSISRRHITVDGDGNLQFAYVDPLDANENLVYQCAATSPVLHGEYRAGDEFRLVLTNTSGRKSTSVKSLWTFPKRTMLAAGSDLELTCIFSGRPAPLIQWSKKEGELPKNRISRKNYGKTLIVHGVNRSDQGTYVCDAEGLAQHEMTVEVSNAPQWVNGPPTDLSLPEESNAELHCRVYGDPAPIVRWYINGQRITDFSADSRRLISASGETLTILNLNHDIDTAVYQCNASNPLGYIFANAFINVFAHAPRFLTDESQTIATVVGRDVDLDCNVEAAPKPVVNWTDDKERQITADRERFQILSNHSLRLLNVGMSDAGLYICNVNNKYGLNHAKRKLEVYTHTRLVTELKPRRAVIEAGSKFQLVCEAEADGRLTLDYQWYHNTTRIVEAASESYRFPQPNHLLITNPRGRHHGDYICVARTKVDSVSSEMTLIVKDVPESPKVLSVECNDRQALIRWAEAYENFESITKYKVEYATAFNRNLWTKTVEEEKTNQKTYEAVINLSPWVNYTFRVIATNRRGDSEPAYSNTTCTTPPSFPYTNPKNVSAAGTEKDNIVIYWQPMNKEDWNGERFRYLVRYRLDEPGAKWEEFEVEDPLENHTVIRDQPTFRRYVVQVQAVNSIGLSLVEPNLVIGYSGEDAPTASPKNVKISEVINSTTVVVEWDPVDADSVKGHFIGYKISVWPIGRESSKQNHHRKPLQITAFHADRSAAISGLEPMSTYKLTVLAFNSEHDGPQSDILYFTTPEGTPSAVLALTVNSIGSTTIVSSWQAPATPQGRLRGYFLSFKRLDQNEKEEETWVPYPRSSYMYEMAKPSTNYEVSVWGETGGGEGEKSSAVVRTWPVQDPAKPDMRVELTGSNSAQVTWLPSDSGMPGTAFYVNYSKLGTDVWQSSEMLTFPTKQVLIRDLEPNKDYVVHVVSKDGDRITQSDAQYFHTVNTTVLQEEVTVEQSLAAVAWFIAVVSAGSIIIILLVVMYIVHRTRGGKYSVKEKELERGTNPDLDEERTFIEYQFGTGCSDVAT